MVRLTRRGACITASSADIARARACFERVHALPLPRLLDADLLAFVQRQIELDGFRIRVHDMLPSRPVDLLLNPSIASALLLLVSNNAPFLDFVRRVTGRDEIQSFSGTVNRRIPGAGHKCAWHADLVDGRVAALTINLSSEPYEGGVLQIREEPDGPIVYEQAVTGPGDAILFKLDRRIKHRVTEPLGHAARTVFAGWFRIEPVRQFLGLTRS